MSRRDLSPEDLDGLLRADAQRQQQLAHRAERTADRARASSDAEAPGGMRAIAALLLVVLAFVLFNVPAAARLIVRYGPDAIAFAVALFQHVAGSLGK